MYNTATHPLSTEEVPTMPVYEYVCSRCKKAFEVIRAITAHGRKAVICPKCRSKKVERRWSNIFVETSSKS